jgi:hypothetical protein
MLYFCDDIPTVIRLITITMIGKEHVNHATDFTKIIISSKIDCKRSLFQEKIMKFHGNNFECNTAIRL